MSQSNLLQASPNYLICMCFIRVRTVAAAPHPTRY